MNRKDFGKLISTLRREHLDRFSSSWTRQRLSEESGIDAEILANIETGRRAILHSDLLLKIADALKLNNGERREFFLASSGVDEQDVYDRLDDPRKALRELLEILNDIQLPALILDQYFDVVAINSMMLDIFELKADYFIDKAANPVTRSNLLRFMFAAEFSKQQAKFGEFFKDFAIDIMMLFRASSLRYRTDAYYAELAKGLYEIDELKNYLRRSPRDGNYLYGGAYINLNHPSLGVLRAITSSTTAISTAGELTLFSLIPLNEETAKAFATTTQQNKFVFQVSQDWPRKNIPAGKK